MSRVLAYARFEALTMLRNGEQLLVALILPALVLGSLGRSDLVDIALAPGQDRLDVVAPGVLGLAIASSGLTSLAIATAFDRRWGVLRQLATTPLGTRGIVAGKVLAVLGVQVVQIVVLGALAVALGWRPDAAGVPIALIGALLGSVAFSAAGLLLAGRLRAEAVLAVANIAWVLMLVVGGLVLPAADGGLAAVVSWLPAGALGDALRAAFVGEVDGVALLVLAAWAAILSLGAAKLFRPSA
ncbi:ABC transporter [Serinibacter arcticus]|uniref:ABC transporter n=1 Tax=Serinibacter arcticus TaxID=1655435 RepID=A0A2U1ZSP0_9MICO|nr:ABC transporter permease [Serinibacter arcticus]PWD49970.1 ABC transporter [Serinibacter arcticus]